jgi:hypothetical protein
MSEAEKAALIAWTAFLFVLANNRQPIDQGRHPIS